MVLMSCVTRGLAQDVVHVLADPGSEQHTHMTGEVLEYTGREITLRRPGGQEQRYPSERVAAVETTRSAEQLAGLQFVEQSKYAEALRQFESALGGEKRAWVRREILAEMVWCLRELGDDARAGEVFLVLVGSDPDALEFRCIPLAWVTAQPSPQLERQSKKWLADEDSSVAMLLGASHLLPTADRMAAIERLKRLTTDRDPRIRALATAQLWRTDSTHVREEEIAARLGDIDKMPAGLRGGPALVLGQALAARQEPHRAAMWLLRLPLVEGRPRRLSARALHDAAQALERVGQQAEAGLLYHELVADYPATPEAHDAVTRLEARRREAVNSNGSDPSDAR